MEITNDAIYYFDIFGFFGAIFDSISRSDYSSAGNAIENFAFTVFAWYLLIASIVSVLAFFLIILLFKKVVGLASDMRSPSVIVKSKEEIPIPKSHQRWEHVLELLASNNPSDWRLAVIEADIILDEIVTRMGYRGETLGDKLKNIEKADFRSLDDAWEAHKIRNIIAHRGSDYVLTQREARRVIELFSRTFKEFGYV